MMKKPRGRRPGQADTRERIRVAARSCFLATGYPGTTLRAVAAAADVDVALISYYFGSKQGLFAAAMTLTVSPAAVLDGVLSSDPERMAEQVVAAVITTWDDPELGGPLKALVTAAMQDAAVLRVFQEYVEREVVARLAERIGGPEATARAGAFLTVVAGVIFTRHLLGLEPMASMPAAELTRRLTSPRGPSSAAGAPPRRRR
jgi:AcrR family transcriptional regulator